MDHYNLQQEYYFLHDGTPNAFLNSLDCNQISLYFVLKNKLGIQTPYELFLDDPSFYIEISKEGLFHGLEAVQYWSSGEVFEIEAKQGLGRESLAEIESKLDKGELVLLQTNLERVPFSKYFVSFDYDPVNLTSGHIIVLIMHDEHQLFYAEAPWMLNMDSFVPYNNSPCIGVIAKDDLKCAFDSFVNYATATVNEAELKKTESTERLYSILKEIAVNSDLPVTDHEEHKRFYNNHALSYLVEAFATGQIHLEQQSAAYPLLNTCGLMAWKYSLVMHKKSILFECIKRHAKSNTAEFDPLLDALLDVMEIGQIFIGKLRKMLNEQKYIPAVELNKDLRKIIQREEVFNSLLKQLFL